MSLGFSCIGVLLVLALAGCGNKPDGTPYGVNPDKHPDGHLKTTTAPVNSYGTGTGMPKGAEMNAVTSGARTGQPLQQMPQDDMPAR
ncbi:hypothetical protein [Hymenobacter cheonanensis]|uniref:hypothetical protein n=1 Tax=Hymenobacter sp. CA2-7 TaxID=3063993 RepID=UPI0027142576|nr:hypothetical protein [Hymenobacter sp. CA2-7]MDO7883794.1 hypothetical protein [Hymenobacter sp. CA2-7]